VLTGHFATVRNMNLAWLEQQPDLIKAGGVAYKDYYDSLLPSQRAEPLRFMNVDVIEDDINSMRFYKNGKVIKTL